jgi:hypothetical protein
LTASAFRSSLWCVVSLQVIRPFITLILKK